MADQNDNPVSLQTEFNYAIDILRMMGWMWRMVKMARLQEDYVSMKNALDNIRMDIQLYIPELGKDFQKEFNENLILVAKNLSVYLHMREQLQDRKDTATRNALNLITSRLRNTLENYERLIKKVIHFKKMDMPEKQDIGMAVLED